LDDQEKQEKIDEAEELIKEAREFLKDKEINRHTVKEILAMRAQIGTLLAIIAEIHAINDEETLKHIYEQLELHEKKLRDEIDNFGKHTTTTFATLLDASESHRDQLIKRGEELLRKAEDFERKHRHEHSIEHEHLREEIIAVKALVDELRRTRDDNEIEKTLERMLKIHE
ncbi:hypothetical protein BLA29_010527, partial [Euroglyphus maynei]